MKERPILFSGPMVRAILDGRKTTTRRVIKPDWWRCLDPDDAEDQQKALTMCPYGEPGDRLWVREKWSHFKQPAGFHAVRPRSMNPDYDWRLTFAADGGEPSGGQWRPSIHMPRWASRLALEVTSVRVERLQDLTESQAAAEGVLAAPFCKAGRPDGMEHVDSFEVLWNALNTARGFGWDVNPWVWVVEFRKGVAN